MLVPASDGAGESAGVAFGDTAVEAAFELPPERAPLNSLPWYFSASEMQDVCDLYSWFWNVVEQSAVRRLLGGARCYSPRQVKLAQQRWRCLSSWGFLTVSAQPSHLELEASSAFGTHWKETMVVCWWMGDGGPRMGAGGPPSQTFRGHVQVEVILIITELG